MADIRAEIQAVRSLLPTGGPEGTARRSARNARLRLKLQKITSSALARVFGEHSLCGIEGIKRLREKQNFSLRDLCKIAEPIGRTGLYSKTTRTLYALILENLPSAIEKTLPAEIQAILREYENTIVDTGTTLLEEIPKLLSSRK